MLHCFYSNCNTLLLSACFLESVRLINGTDRCSGRLEVFHNGQWGKICNSNWDLPQAKMVCKELECGAPQQIHSPLNFGNSGGQTGLTSRCAGNVESITQCTLLESTRPCEGVSLSCAGKTIRRTYKSLL